MHTQPGMGAKFVDSPALAFATQTPSWRPPRRSCPATSAARWKVRGHGLQRVLCVSVVRSSRLTEYASPYSQTSFQRLASSEFPRLKLLSVDIQSADWRDADAAAGESFASA